jgi:hypothetical protein
MNRVGMGKSLPLLGCFKLTLIKVATDGAIMARWRDCT